MKKLTPALSAYAYSIAIQFPACQQRHGVWFHYRGERFRIVLDDLGEEIWYKVYIDDDSSSIYMRYFGKFKRHRLLESFVSLKEV